MIRRLGYTLVLWGALPLVLARLFWRGFREPGYRKAMGERFGFYRSVLARSPRQKLIWVHAVSLGEVHAAKPLIDRLLRAFPGDQILITNMTAAGRDAAQRMFGDRAQIVWLPYDYQFAVRRFLTSFQPHLAIFVETEIWFNLIRACRARGVPLMLANARLSEKSAAGYLRIATLAREAFGAFDAVAAQTAADADRLANLGARAPRVVGNIKFDAAAAPGSSELALAFKMLYGPRRVLLLASTREGEEALLLDALAARPLKDALIVIVPRHPQRFADVANLLEKRRLPFSRRSGNQPVPAEHSYVLGDSVGEMSAYYRTADVAFVGGSLLDYGGQNLIEACAAGVPVLFGPSTYNFASAAEAAVAAGAARRVGNASQAIALAGELISDEGARAAMGEAGRSFCETHRGAADQIANMAVELLASRKPTCA